MMNKTWRLLYSLDIAADNSDNDKRNHERKDKMVVIWVNIVVILNQTLIISAITKIRF